MEGFRIIPSAKCHQKCHQIRRIAVDKISPFCPRQIIPYHDANAFSFPLRHICIPTKEKQS